MAAGRTILPPNSTGNAYVDDVYTATIDGTPTTVHQQRVGLYDASGNPVSPGDATSANQAALNTLVGAVNETAPATDIASSGLNGRLQRIAQRLTSLIALFPASLGQKLKATSFPVVIASDQDALTVTGTFFQATQPVSGTVTATGPLTDTQIRATALPVSGTVTANAGSGTMAVSGPLTDTQLRASALPVSGTLTANAGTGTMATSNAGLPSSLGQKTAANSTSVVLASDQGAVPVVGTLVGAVANFTRPADTTAYAAKDVVSDSTTVPTVLQFAGAGRVNAGSGYVVKAKLSTDQKINTATFRLWLYNTAPTAINDNSPFLLLYANVAIRVGYIDFPALSTEDATNSTGAESIVTAGTVGPLSYICAANDTKLYGVLEATSVFTPASGQNFHVGLTFDQN